MDITSARLSNVISNFSLKSTAVRGVLWTVAAFGSQQVLRFASNLILTRLLIPEFFGLMALVNSLRLGLELFSDVGIGQNIIQSPRGEDPLFLNTAWSIQIIRGILLWLACWAIAQPIA
ncbi:MAG: oligosaccharide flippase family protein, partial [Cyanobacteria bacterium P01_E01_bin.34]